MYVHIHVQHFHNIVVLCVCVALNVHTCNATLCHLCSMLNVHIRMYTTGHVSVDKESTV